jgi:hypothetical protein
MKDEAAVEKALAILEQCGKGLLVGLAVKDAPERRWYTFTEMALRVLRAVGTTSGDTMIRVACASLYGSINLFGLKETARLIIQVMRSNYVATRTKK